MQNDDIQLHKLPPQNLEAEEMVLGAVMVGADENAIDLVRDIVRPEDFYKGANEKIFSAMLLMFDRGESIDLITLPEALRQTNALESVGGAAYLAYLVSRVPTAANIKAHARIVREKAVLRRMIHAGSDIIKHGYEAPRPAAELLDEAEKAILDIGAHRSGNALAPASAIIGESFRMVEQRYERKELVTGLATGFVDLDEKTAGLQPSDLIIVAARPSMGKTAFALNVAAHAAIDNGKRIAIFSLEMSREQLVLRMLGSESRVDAHRIRTGQLQDRDWTPLSNAAGRIAEAKIFIDDTAAITAMDIRSKCRRQKAESGLDLVIVDYLQLMRGNSRERSREQEVSDISRSLKALARELNVPIVALSQLNRDLEKRVGNNQKPRLADLRESGAIEQDADVILFIHRQEVFLKCECTPPPAGCLCGRRGAAEVIIGKQRNGPTDTVNLAFIKYLTRFENAERRENRGVEEAGQ